MSKPLGDTCEWLHTQLGFYQSEFSTDAEISVAVCTFNVNNQRLPEDDRTCESKLRNWLLLHESPKIIAVGLQEIDMNAHSVLFGTSDARNYWRSVLCAIIGADEDEESITHSYLMVASRQLVGLFLCVFVHKSIRPDLDLHELDVSTVSIGKSLGPIRENRKSALFNFGNKGAIGVHLQFHGLSIVFVNAHLHPHIEGLQKRRQGISTIMKDMNFRVSHTMRNYHLYQKYFHSSDGAHPNQSTDWTNHQNEPSNQKSYSLSIEDHDIVFFFGDLNFRLASPSPYVLKRAVMMNDWESVFDKFDQLNMELLRGRNDPSSGWFPFRENHVKTAPSYRYVPHKNLLDLPDGVMTDDGHRSDKGRIPGFTDRILWAEPKIVDAQKTDVESQSKDVSIPQARPVSRLRQKAVDVHAEVDFSDHKPVSALYGLTVPTVDPHARSVVERRLIHAFEQDKQVTQSIRTQSLFSVNTEEINFGNVEFGTKHRVILEIRNTSCSVLPVDIRNVTFDNASNLKENHAKFHNREKSELRTTHTFIDIIPSQVVIYPGETCTVNIQCEVNRRLLRFQLDSDFRGRIGQSVEAENIIAISSAMCSSDSSGLKWSPDRLVTVTAGLYVTNLGNTLENIVPRYADSHIKELPLCATELVSFPMWWLIHFLSAEPSAEDLQNVLKDHSDVPSVEELSLIELLDKQHTQVDAWETCPMWENVSWGTAYRVLCLFLRELQEPIIDFASYELIVNRCDGEIAIFDDIVRKLSPVHRTNFIFIISFLRYLLTRSYALSKETTREFRCKLLGDFVELIIPPAPRTDPFEDPNHVQGSIARRVFLDYFVTMEHEL
ncbi:inositol/phosphatidylinositol phosphatase [Perkinsela sp. CCAP 1560/4]|nr:inositol/phosphatidylinositol phosphatase [Perkinsela sp. CCAP 1560/4]|eukprot:KNH07509.1 inositol/phosphatidylinositol phosphatase [Perkinsela sp. CCAP 1560/4]